MRRPPLLRLLAAAGLLLAALSPAGPGPSADPPAKAAPAPAHVRWRRSYGAALLEARLRNVPVLVTRHKDG